jgi:RNA polymerase sigma-70 factor (ECF subfamily)
VDAFVARVDASPHFAADVRHELRDRLLVAAPGALPKIAHYSGRGPLAAWVRIAAVRLAIDLKRAAKPVFDAARLPDVADADNPEVQLLKSQYAGEYQAALRESWLKLSVRERSVLRLHYVDGRNLDEVGVLYKVARATAGRWIAGARERILDEMMQILAARLKLTQAELDSIARLVRRDLHLSLSPLAVEE